MASHPVESVRESELNSRGRLPRVSIEMVMLTLRGPNLLVRSKFKFRAGQYSTITSFFSIVDMEYFINKSTQSRFWNGFSSQVDPMYVCKTRIGFHMYYTVCTF
jgi:hypothetical protein